MKLNDTSFLAFYSLTLAAGQEVIQNVTGQMFRCTESSAKFKMRFDDSPYFPMEVGLGFRLENLDGFSQLSFKNDTAAPITLQFYAGRAEVNDARLNTLLERNIGLVQKDAPSTFGGADAFALPAGQTVNVTLGAGIRRKILIVSNLHATDPLYLADNAGVAGAVIFARTTEQFYLDGNLKIHNPGANAITFIMGAAVYDYA